MTPTPIPWHVDELKKAHDYRARVLLECTQGTRPSKELMQALLTAEHAECKLTECESAYNEALSTLRKIIT